MGQHNQQVAHTWIAQSRGRHGIMCKFESKERGRRGTMWQFESKEVCESLCFHSKSECARGQKLVVWDGVCGAVSARSRRVARLILGIAFLWNFGVRRGCGKESNARHIVGECNCRVPDALAGEFRGCGKGSNARHIIGECNCRVLDACRDS